MRTTYAKITHSNPSWSYLTPLEENEEATTQLLDIIEEGNYVDLSEETIRLTPGEVAMHLIDFPATEYVYLNEDHVQKLMKHKENAIKNFGEEAYNNDEYHRMILDMFESGKLFKVVPKHEVITHLIKNI